MKKLKLLTEKKYVVSGLWEVDASIIVDTHYTDKNGRILFSPSCKSAIELKGLADALIKELENIKRQADKLKWDNHPSRQK